MIIRFPIESGYQYPRLTMKLPVKVRVSHKKIAFFYFPLPGSAHRKHGKTEKG